MTSVFFFSFLTSVLHYVYLRNLEYETHMFVPKKRIWNSYKYDYSYTYLIKIVPFTINVFFGCFFLQLLLFYKKKKTYTFSQFTKKKTYTFSLAKPLLSRLKKNNILDSVMLWIVIQIIALVFLSNSVAITSSKLEAFVRKLD